ncbi:hypothetical protein EAE99_011064 [Botrytis elliptica]|nr:hypothetical protein EAE99_011064 [Botrytis elliptica]
MAPVERAIQGSTTTCCPAWNHRWRYGFGQNHVLIQFIETSTENLDFSAAEVAARKDADITRKLDAVLGRASYVGKDNLQIEEAGM